MGPPQSYSCFNYRIGRHAFTRVALSIDEIAGYALTVHVPPTGRLDDTESRESISRAIEFFARHYPDQPLSALACHSWILDPQLTEYLSADSNLIQFQQRFRILPHVSTEDEWAGDREVMRLGLQLETPDNGPLADADLERVPADTSLQRAFVAHIRSGRHWHQRTGIMWL